MRTPCDDEDDGEQSGSQSRSDFQEEDFVCVPLSNLNKDAVTFNTKDQLLKKSLMMSEISNLQGATDRLNEKVEGIRSMVMYAAKLEKNDSSLRGSMVHKLRDDESSSNPGESHVSIEFPEKAKEQEPEIKVTDKSEASQTNKKEMQTLKYITDGGITIKRNLFDDWHHVYEKEVNFLDPKDKPQSS